MLKFIANLFGIKPTAPTAPAPYKVETPALKVTQFPAQSTEKPAKVAKPKVVKKPTVKKTTTRKPRAPKA